MDPYHVDYPPGLLQFQRAANFVEEPKSLSFIGFTPRGASHFRVRATRSKSGVHWSADGKGFGGAG